MKYARRAPVVEAIRLPQSVWVKKDQEFREGEKPWGESGDYLIVDGDRMYCMEEKVFFARFEPQFAVGGHSLTNAQGTVPLGGWVSPAESWGSIPATGVATPIDPDFS